MKQDTGTIGWTDLTVENAEQLRDFYRDVVGWQFEPHDMGGYSDFVMKSPDGNKAVAGICHARGVNADLPGQWLVYIIVTDLDRSVGRCRELGGRIISGPRSFGGQGRYCVLQDPAGAVAALFEPAGKSS